MSSNYKRDDKQFRAQIAKLADSGLNLHVGANCSIHRATNNAPKQTPKGKLPEFVAGLIAYASLGACVLFLIKWVILPLLGAL
jgi:hypothetical protein